MFIIGKKLQRKRLQEAHDWSIPRPEATWTVGKVQDRFLLDLIKYLKALVWSKLSVPHFLRHNPIGERYMDPNGYLHKELYAHVKYNKLIWDTWCALCVNMLSMYINFHMLPLPFP